MMARVVLLLLLLSLAGAQVNWSRGTQYVLVLVFSVFLELALFR